MARVKFTSALSRFFPDLGETDSKGDTVAEVIQSLNSKHPGLIDYLLEENGSLRKHVNVFLDQKMVSDRRELSDTVNGIGEILIFQALSGG